MLQVTDVTGDKSFEAYTDKNFDFIFDHLELFQQQAKEFGPQPYGYRRLLDMKELDDCGAIGAALIKTYQRTKDPRYLPVINQVADFISNKMTRDADGTLARPRPHPGVGLVGRHVHEHSLPRADGRADRRAQVLRRRARGR